jgi:hypothetical protein
MDLQDAILRFNESSEPKIALMPGRDGRVQALLPRMGRTILVTRSLFKDDVRVTAADVLALVEEARRAMAPSLALLDTALAQLVEADPKPV